MEKTTKKRKKSKRLKRRIGLIAVGGLSFVLTICLSVGATLAWFAGSTWASNDMYMGGPVYVEMAGRGENGYTTDTGLNDANLTDAIWKGGKGELDIVASERTTGTASGQDNSNILLPGQKLLIYSQARVYSTLETSTVADNAYPSESSGANNTNVSNGTATYYRESGRVQSTTTSVLRAKFSIDIEFDPSVGFNNFTDRVYAEGYPKQSSNYIGEYGTEGFGTAITDDTSSLDKVNTPTTDIDKDGPTVGEAPNQTGTGTAVISAYIDTETNKAALTWESALEATSYTLKRTYVPTAAGTPYGGTSVITEEKGRRDAVANATLVEGTDYVAGLTGVAANGSVKEWVTGFAADGTTPVTSDLWQMKWGMSKSIYKWKYVSEGEYNLATNANYRLGAPFNGMYNTSGGASAKNGGSGNGFYALYEVDESGSKLESEGFYKARTSAYLKSYVEHYVDDYGRNLVMQIGTSLTTLEDALNNSFINLISQSSDNIYNGNVTGFDADDAGNIVYDGAAAGIPASWLYVDPTIGNDTNAGDSASSVGGWWYLVENDTANGTDKSHGNNTIKTEIDKVTAMSKSTDGGTTAGDTGAATFDQTTGVMTYNFGTQDVGSNNTATVPADAKSVPYESFTFQRAEDESMKDDGSGNMVRDTDIEGTQTNFYTSKDKQILMAKLYEITPTLEDAEVAINPTDGTKTTKVVSYAFPFVNGNFELPGQALTNIFANAKISFKITFQALQAFFPYSNSIDSIPSGTAITGTGKALNIANAIPIYNEAFDYLAWL